MKEIKCPECRYPLNPFWDGTSLFLICESVTCGLEFEWDNLEERKQLRLNEDVEYQTI